MKVLRPGDPAVTGLREVKYKKCLALLEVTRADIREKDPEAYYPGRPMREIYYIYCPECGDMITFKSKTEN